MSTRANRRTGAEAASWLPLGFNPAERALEVRYLPVMTEAVAGDDAAGLAFWVSCPRRGKLGVEECAECAHAGRLRHHGRRGPLVLECTLERR